jgi:HEAT repeat protein
MGDAMQANFSKLAIIPFVKAYASGGISYREFWSSVVPLLTQRPIDREEVLDWLRAYPSRKVQIVGRELADYFRKIADLNVDIDDIKQTWSLQPYAVRSNPNGLIADLIGQNLELRRTAAYELGRIGALETDAAVPALIDALNDEDGGVRLVAAKALENIGPAAAAAIPALTAWLSGENRDEARVAAYALGGIGAGSAVPALAACLLQERSGTIDGLDFEDPSYAAAYALGRIGSPGANAAVPALITILTSERVNLHFRAATALGKIGPAAVAAVPALVAALGQKGPGEFLRQAAAEALGQIGTGAIAALPALVEAASHDDWDRVRCAARDALALIDPDGEAFLAHMRSKGL